MSSCDSGDLSAARFIIFVQFYMNFMITLIKYYTKAFALFKNVCHIVLA